MLRLHALSDCYIASDEQRERREGGREGGRQGGRDGRRERGWRGGNLTLMSEKNVWRV